MRLHPLVLPWRFDGQCIYDTGAQTRADAVVIALAGPAASIGCGLLSWLGMQAVSGTSSLHVVLQVATFLAIGSGLIRLIPLTLRDARGMRARTDGAQALAAFLAT